MLKRKADDSFETQRTLRLVGQVSADDGGDTYIGCELYWKDGLDSKRIYAFMFAAPVPCNFDKNKVTANCKKAMSINSDDGKLQMAVCGIGTCSNTYNCERCLRRKNDNRYPQWVRDTFPNLVEQSECADYPLRAGKDSLKNCYERYKRGVGENNEYLVGNKLSPDDILDCYSVTDKPARWNDPRYLNGGFMHMLMGVMTHLSEETVKKLRALSTDDSWSKANKLKFIKAAKAILAKGQAPEYKEAKAAYNRIKRELKKLEKAHAKAVEEKDVDVALEKYLLVQEMREDMESHAEESGFGATNRELKGANGFMEAVKDGKDGQKLDQLDQAEFVFRRAMTTKAGSFNKQHGSMELTARRSMLALARREEIYDLTVQAFADNKTKQQEITEIMDWWKQQAETLFELGKIMESQEKVTPERLADLKRYIVKFGMSWHAKITPTKILYFGNYMLLNACS